MGSSGGGGLSKIGFIFSTTILFLFIANVSALVGTEVVSGFNPQPAFSFTGISILDIFIGVANNLVIFTQLLTISSEFALFNSIVVVGYVMGLGWAIMELIRGS